MSTLGFRLLDPCRRLQKQGINLLLCGPQDGRLEQDGGRVHHRPGQPHGGGVKGPSSVNPATGTYGWGGGRRTTLP
jgi:hypothetical protein